MIFKLFTKFGEFVIFSDRSFQIEFLDCKLEGKYLKLPKMTAVRMKLHRPISEKWKLKSVTVSREPSGKYFASLAESFDAVCVEDLNLKGMAGGLHLGKGVHDNG